MSASIYALKEWLETANRRALGLVVDQDAARLRRADEDLMRMSEVRVVNIGRVLGNHLLDIEPRRRTKEAERWVLEACGEPGARPCIVANVDILFHPQLDTDTGFVLNPLELFIRASRVTPIVALWPGSFDDGILHYAVPSHYHHRCWRKPDVDIIRFE